MGLCCSCEKNRSYFGTSYYNGKRSNLWRCEICGAHGKELINDYPLIRGIPRFVNQKIQPINKPRVEGLLLILKRKMKLYKIKDKLSEGAI